MTYKTVITVILLTLVLISVLFAFYSSDGLASKVAKYISDKALEYFKVFGFKTENLDSEVEKKAKDDFTRFYELMTAEGKNCIAKGKIPVNDYIIQIQDNGGLYMRLVDEDGQMLASLPEKGSGPRVVPCVIAGANNEAQNFYNCYAAKAGGCAGPFYSTSTGEISIQDGELHMGGETYDLKVSGITDDIMYIDGANKCFFAEDEWDWSTYDEDGLDGDVIRDVAQGKTKLPTCGVQSMCQEKTIRKCSDYDEAYCESNPCNIETQNLAGRCRLVEETVPLGNNIYQTEKKCIEFTDTESCDAYGKANLPLERCRDNGLCTLMVYEGKLGCINRGWTDQAQACTDYTNPNDCESGVALLCEWDNLGDSKGTCRSLCIAGTICPDYKTEYLCESNPCRVIGNCIWKDARCMTATNQNH